MASVETDAGWVVLAAMLVILLQAGFTAREAGFTRAKNATDVAARRLIGTLLVVVLYWLLGHSLMFGASRGGLVGAPAVFLDKDPGATGLFLLQLAYATTAAAVLSGAVAERARLPAYLAMTVVFGALIYPIFGHWAWGGGWLARRGFIDVGGATVVHSLGGWLALAGVLAVGPRTGRFGEDGKPRKIPGASMPLAVLGLFLLWFGWLGLVVGGRPPAGGGWLPVLAANIAMAGAGGGAAALLAGWLQNRRPPVVRPVNGVLAGLVAISASAPALSPTAALAVGASAGLLAGLVADLLERARLDDAVGAVPVHLAGGIWGSLCVALVADPAHLGSSLSRGAQLKVQIEGILAAGIWGFGASFVVLALLARLGRLRVSPEAEEAGLSASELDTPLETQDLIEAMDEQARTGDMTMRAPVEPFTEVGQIAKQYNRVIETIQFATAQTESLVSTSLDALITFNTEGIITSSNPAASAIFGYGEREFRTVSVTALFAPSGETRMRADLPTVLTQFVGHTHEARGLRRSGDELDMEASFNYVAVGEDEIYTATFRDITKRKETETLLARTQAEIRRRMEQELSDAKAVQKALLPGETERRFHGCEIAEYYQSATETGGDWFGYHHNADERTITFYMGDVTGHGLPAALMSGVVCGAVYSSEYTHGLLGDRTSLAERKLRNVADVVNRIVLETGKGELLMTMAFLHIDLKSGQLLFLNAGHNLPFIVSGNQVASLVGRGSRLGESARPEFELTRGALSAGDIVVMYTDGLVENPGPDGKVVSVRELKKALTAGGSVATAASVLGEIMTLARSVWQDQPAMDDQSVLVFKWVPTA